MKTIEERQVEALEKIGDWMDSIWWILLAIFIAILIAPTIRADSTFVPIEPPKPNQCGEVII